MASERLRSILCCVTAKWDVGGVSGRENDLM